MSAVSYQSFVSSKPFLIFGPGKTLFYAHGNLLAKCSPVLSRDVHGDMREKQLETIEIKDIEGDIDDDTVLRFIEYAYTSDYTVPEPDIVQLPTDSEELQEAFKFDKPRRIDEDDWAFPTRNSKKDKKKTRRPFMFEEDNAPEEPKPVEEALEVEIETYMGLGRRPGLEVQGVQGPALQKVDLDRKKLWEVFLSQAYTVQRPPWQPRDGNDHREDYTGVFLCHARLYKFSDRYGCAELMTLTLQKLRLTLAKYRVYLERVSDVVELIRYTYVHTLDRDQGQDQLRALVLDFAVCYFQHLVQHPSFLKLLEEGGPLSSDLIVRIAKLVS